MHAAEYHRAILVLSRDSGSGNATEVPGGTHGRLFINGLFRRAPLLLAHVSPLQCSTLRKVEVMLNSAFVDKDDPVCHAKDAMCIVYLESFETIVTLRHHFVLYFKLTYPVVRFPGVNPVDRLFKLVTSLTPLKFD